MNLEDAEQKMKTCGLVVYSWKAGQFPVILVGTRTTESTQDPRLKPLILDNSTIEFVNDRWVAALVVGQRQVVLGTSDDLDRIVEMLCNFYAFAKHATNFSLIGKMLYILKENKYSINYGVDNMDIFSDNYNIAIELKEDTWVISKTVGEQTEFLGKERSLDEAGMIIINLFNVV